ncbi:MAG TPA: ABC transporter permease [Actinophytocola sp.]|uniref:ABC transporter permease n=1 Tax=Actinophytocola sp. TaxID=1872138 RepID=UPI002DB78E3D|nr:ABC transporter permease [Actinophytocola sp.]HEU5472097.1 ABC transporter permease [Actinophytocola sp.]
MTTPPDPADLRFPAESMLTEPVMGEQIPVDDEVTARPGKRRSNSQFRDIWLRYRRNKLAVVGLVVVILLIVTALLAPFITPYDPREQNLLNAIEPPSAEHWFGTDVLGRDLFSMLLYGLQLALLVGVLTMLGSLLIGVTMGAIAGYLGRAWDGVLMRITDIFLAFPYLIGALVIVRSLDPGRTKGVGPVIVALVILGWTTTARLMRGQVLALRESEYVEAARSIGASSTRIVVRHLLPNAIAPVLVYAFTSIGVAVVAMASLSFLGVGVSIDTPEWGQMISQGFRNFGVPNTSFLWVFPSIAIIITTLAFAFVSDGLRDSLDPKLR